MLGAVGAFVFLLCAIAVMFELDATSRPTGGALDSTFVGLLAHGALLAVAVPLLVGRLALGQQR